MAPQCFKSDIDVTDVITYEEQQQQQQQSNELTDDHIQEWLQWLQQAKRDILKLHNYVQQFGYEQTQEEFDQQEYTDEQYEQETQEYTDEKYEQETLECIEQQLQQLKFKQQQFEEEMQQDQVNEQTLQHPKVYREMRQLRHEIRLIKFQIHLIELREELIQIQQQDGLDRQQINRQKLFEELTQQKHLQQLQKELQDVQHDIQFQMLRERVIVVWVQMYLAEETQQQPENQQLEDELQEVKHQLNILLVYLQRIQLEQLLDQVQQELNKQQRYPIQYKKTLQLIQQHIDRLKQLKQQPMPGKQQLSFLVIVLFRQLTLQHHLNSMMLQLHVMEFKLKLPYVEKQIDILEKQLQQLQPEQKLLQKLESVKEKSKSIQLDAKKLIIVLAEYRKRIKADLDRPKTTRKKILNRKKMEKVHNKLIQRVYFKDNQVRFHKHLFGELKQVQREMDQLQQEIDQQPLQL